MSAALRLVSVQIEEEEGPIEVAVEDLEEVDDYDGWILREGSLLTHTEMTLISDNRHHAILVGFCFAFFLVFTINFILAAP